MTAIEIVRLTAEEFKDVSDETLEKWLEIVRPMVNKKKFGKLYEQALACLVCHKLKMAGNGSTEFGSITDIGRVSSVSEGGTSVSFATTTAGDTRDAEYKLTSYGVQYIALRNRCVVPIAILPPEGML